MSLQTRDPEGYARLMHQMQILLGGDQLVIEFIEPDKLHQGSDTTTVAEVAHFLEMKYHLLEKFSKRIEKDLTKRFALEILRNKNVKRAFAMLEEHIKNEWRDYINDRQTGMTTAAAQRENRAPFIDTGEYFQMMKCKITVKKS